MRDCDWADKAKPIAVAGSLVMIRDAKSQLRAPGDVLMSPEAITSRIRLCNVLLDEIRDIRARLERSLSAKRPSARPGRMARGAMN